MKLLDRIALRSPLKHLALACAVALGLGGIALGAEITVDPGVTRNWNGSNGINDTSTNVIVPATSALMLYAIESFPNGNFTYSWSPAVYSDTIGELHVTSGAKVWTGLMSDAGWGGVLSVTELYIDGVQQPHTSVVENADGSGLVRGNGWIQVGGSADPSGPAPTTFKLDGTGDFYIARQVQPPIQGVMIGDCSNSQYSDNSYPGGGFGAALDLNGHALTLPNTYNNNGAISGNGTVHLTMGGAVNGDVGNTYTGTTTVSGDWNLIKTSGNALGGDISVLANSTLHWGQWNYTTRADDQIADDANVTLTSTSALMLYAYVDYPDETASPYWPVASDTIGELHVVTGSTVHTGFHSMGTAKGGVLSVSELYIDGVKQAHETIVAPIVVSGLVVTGKGQIRVGGSGEPVYTVAPSAPATPTPADGNTTAVHPISVPKFDWSDCLRVETYDFYLWLASATEPVVGIDTPTAADLTSSECPVAGPLASLTAYKWKVVAKNIIGGTSSPVWTFTTVDRGDISTILTPGPEGPGQGMLIDDTVGIGNTARLVGSTQTFWGSGGFSVDINLNGNTLILDTGNGNPHNDSGAIFGAGELRLQGPALQITGGTGNTYTGTTTVSSAATLGKSSGNALCGTITMYDASALTWANNNQINDTSDMTLLGSASMNLAGFSDTIAGLTLSAGAKVKTGSGGVLTVSSLTVNGLPITGGTYTSADGFVTGTGSLVVLVPESAAILTMNFPGLGSCSINPNPTHRTVALSVPNGTPVTSLSPTYTLSSGTCLPASSSPHNFASPVTYTVTDGETTNIYTVTVTVRPPVVLPLVDQTTGANWRTAAAYALPGSTMYGADGYLIYGLNAGDGDYRGGYDGSADQTHLPAAITSITRGTNDMWSGNGNFGLMEDPENGNALTAAPLLVGGSTFTIHRTATGDFRLTILVASGDGANATYTTTVNDGVTTQTLTATHTENGVYYHVYDVAAGSGDVTVTAGSTNGWSATGFAFDMKPTVSALATETVVTGNGTSTVGDGVTFTATVTPASGSAFPTGNVQFKLDGTTNLELVPVTAGEPASNGTAATASITTIPVGIHTITAEYLPDTTGFLTSTSPEVTQTVLSKYGKWAVDKGLDSGNNGATQDPDADAVPNFMEFAFNGNPKSAADNGMIHVLTETSADHNNHKVLVLTIAVRTGTGTPADWAANTNTATIDGITYTIQGGTTLANFASDTGTVFACAAPVITGLPLTPGAGYEWRSFILNSSEGLGTKGFLRAMVVEAP